MITKKGLMLKLDKLVKEMAFARDGKCVTCPIWADIKPDHRPSNVMQPGHFITRGAKTVRWDLRNVYQQCKTCNFLHEHRSSVMASYVVEYLGKKSFDALVFLGNQNKPSIKKWELEEIYENLNHGNKGNNLI